MNRAAQALADAEEGQSLHADLPYASFTPAGEECFINGLSHSVTFDLCGCLPQQLKQAVHQSKTSGKERR